MRMAPVVLGISLLANAALGLAVYSRWTSAAPTSVNGVGTSQLQPKGGDVAAGSPGSSFATEREKSDAKKAASRPIGFAALDDVSYIARLRELGFPPEAIRVLVATRLRERYAERMRNIQRTQANEYWRTGPFGMNNLSREARAALRGIHQEMAAELEKLLGAEGERASPFAAARRAILDFLPAAKIRQIDAINKDYSELMAQVRERSRGMVLRADREELRLLEREQRADLAAALGPDELREYDLRASPAANGVRNRLVNFEPSEDEYRALAKIQLEFDLTFPASNPSAQEQEARRAAEKELTAKIQAALTPERYADYRVTTDGAFRDNAQFVREAGLDRQVAKDLIALKQDLWQRADAVRNQRELTPDQRAAALTALEQEASTQLTAKLGEKTFADYKKYGAGTWLARLKPPASSPARR